jgi:hypothetical protein
MVLPAACRCQRQCLTIHSPENSFSEAAVIALAFRRRCGASHLWTLSDVGHVSSRRRFVCLKLYYCRCIVLFGTSFIRIRIAKYYTNIISPFSMWSNVHREHVLLVK